jgi:hypothetical protein
MKEYKMATKKTPINSKLLEAATATPPANPALTGADRTFVRGLIRRGYTEGEVIALGQKASLNVTAADLVPKGRKPKSQVVTPQPLQPQNQV